MTNTIIAQTILQQLGGNRFIAMTGAKNFLALENGIRFNIGKNASRANKVKITVNGLDLYDIEFYKYTAPRFNSKTFTMTDEKIEVVKTLESYYGDMLQDAFTEVTGMYTHL